MTEQTLSTPKNEEEYFDAMNKAVSEGNKEEIDRLMTMDLSDGKVTPDAKDKEEEGKEDSADKADTDTTNSEVQKTGEDKPDSDSTPDAAKKDEAASTPAKTDPPALTPEQVNLLLQKVHRLESDVGRVGHLQSEISKLSRELKKTKAEAAKAAKPEESEEQRKFRERIKALKEIDPEQAETLSWLEEQTRKAQQSQKSNEEPEDDAEEIEVLQKQELQKAVRIVESVHPDAVAIFRHPTWKTWKASLSPDKLDWAESDEPGKVITALHAFKSDMAAATKTAQQPPEVKGGDPDKTASKAADEGTDDKVSQARERKLQDNGSSRNTPIKSKGAVDQDALFSEMYNDILKKNHIGT